MRANFASPGMSRWNAFLLRFNPQRWVPFFVMAAGMTILGLVSFVDYFCARIYNEDFQYVREVVNSYAQGKILEPVWNTPQHYSLSVYISAVPFYILFGNVGILLYQWLMVGVGAWGIYAYARLLLPRGSIWPLVHFFGMWGLYSALAGCIYLEVTGLLMVPWIFYAFHRKKWYVFAFFFAFIVFSKENHAIWSIFLLPTLWFLYRQEMGTARWKALWIAGIGVIAYLIIIFGIINPYLLSKSGHSISRIEFLYNHLWASDNPFNPTVWPTKWHEKIRNIIRNLPYLWALLWTEPCTDFYGNPCWYLRGIKSEFHLAVLVSGGWTFYKNPVFLFTLLPVYAYKLLTAEPQTWGTIAHYSIEFSVILPISLIWFMRRFSAPWAWRIGLIAAVLAHLMNYMLLERRLSIWYIPELFQWYSCNHYCDPALYKEITEAAQRIHPGDITLMQPRLRPYFPIPDGSNPSNTDKPSTWMFIVTTDPFSPNADSVRSLLRSGEWYIAYEGIYVKLLRKKDG